MDNKKVKTIGIIVLLVVFLLLSGIYLYYKDNIDKSDDNLAEFNLEKGDSDTESCVLENEILDGTLVYIDEEFLKIELQAQEGEEAQIVGFEIDEETKYYDVKFFDKDNEENEDFQKEFNFEDLVEGDQLSVVILKNEEKTKYKALIVRRVFVDEEE